MFNNSYYPYNNYGSTMGALSGLKRFNWSSFLDGAQRTLGVINQAIPLFYQIKPLYENAKTAFKVVNAIKEDDPKVNTVKEETKKENKVDLTKSSGSPTYFL